MLNEGSLPNNRSLNENRYSISHWYQILIRVLLLKLMAIATTIARVTTKPAVAVILLWLRVRIGIVVSAIAVKLR